MNIGAIEIGRWGNHSEDIEDRHRSGGALGGCNHDGGSTESAARFHDDPVDLSLFELHGRFMEIVQSRFIEIGEAGFPDGGDDAWYRLIVVHRFLVCWLAG